PRFRSSCRCATCPTASSSTSATRTATFSASFSRRPNERPGLILAPRHPPYLLRGLCHLPVGPRCRPGPARQESRTVPLVLECHGRLRSACRDRLLHSPLRCFLAFCWRNSLSISWSGT